MTSSIIFKFVSTVKTVCVPPPTSPANSLCPKLDAYVICAPCSKRIDETVEPSFALRRDASRPGIARAAKTPITTRVIKSSIREKPKLFFFIIFFLSVCEELIHEACRKIGNRGQFSLRHAFAQKVCGYCAYQANGGMNVPESEEALQP